MNFTQDFADGFRNLFVQIILREVQTTSRVIGAIPNARRDYRPDERSRSAWELAWHVASDVWFLEGVAGFSFEANPDLSHPNPTNTPEALADWYATRARASVDKIIAMPSDRLLESLAIGAAAEAGTSFPAFLYLLFAHNHMVHHRGQLSAYLRAMGGSVPSIYGPTADT